MTKAHNDHAVASLREEIRLLRAKLEDALIVPGSTEETARALLRDLDIAVNRLPDVRLVAHRIKALEDFWLHHIAWCSLLSKEIEKILILCEDVFAGG